MTFQSVPDVVETVLDYTSISQPMANVLNWVFGGGYDQSEVDALATAVDVAVGDYIIPLLSSAVHYDGVRARGLELVEDLFAAANANAGSGTAEGAAQPSQQSYAVQLGTGLTGRSARGRLYFPPTGAGAISNARTVTQDYSDACVDALADLMEDVTAACGALPVVVSRFSGGVPRSEGTLTFVTTILARNNNIDTQRRRVGK